MPESKYKEEWIDQALSKMKLVYPEDDETEMREFLSESFDRDYVDNKCTIYNNYEKEEIETSILKLYDWIDEAHPILTESGSMFKQHKECSNPNTRILGNKLDERKVEKKKKFKYTDLANHESDSEKKAELKYLAKKADLAQLRLKTIANSEYGVSGLPSSWFFNMACASATTARGQALISTAFNAFEDFLCDNVSFTDMDECLMFINNIVNEKDKRTKNDAKWVKNKSTTDVCKRLYNKFYTGVEPDKDMISRIISNLSQEDKNRIYYKSNLFEFVRNSSKAIQLIKNIAQCDDEEFLDPVKPPKEIKKNLDKLRSAVIEYVHYNYPTPNRVYKLKTVIRKCVIVIDTDSNFINLNLWYEFVMNEILTGYVKIQRKTDKNGRLIVGSSNPEKRVDHKYDEQKKFRILSTMINILTEMINNTLETFAKRSNIEPDHPGVLNMKNEFLHDSILITPAKKHYQSAVRIQEGVYFPKPDFDIKGRHAPIVSDNYMMIYLIAGRSLI